MTETNVLEYKDPDRGRFPLKSVVRTLHEADDAVTESMEFEEYSFRESPPSDFTLESFGLDEPKPLVTNAWQGWGPTAVLISAVVIGGLYVFLISRRRKRS